MRITELRESKNASQSELAKVIDTTQQNISNWENLKSSPNCVYLIALADFFDCSIDYLLGRENDFGIIENKTKLKIANEEREILAIWAKLNYKNKCLLLGRALEILENQKE